MGRWKGKGERRVMLIRDIHGAKRARVDLDTRLKGYRVSQNVTVTWSWYDEAQGIVEWSFHNLGSQTESVILLRNNYFFGGAFWCVYIANSPPLCPTCTGGNGFGTHLLTVGELVNGQPRPLTDNGVEHNAPPMAPVYFQNASASLFGKGWQVLFIFTLNAGQTWSMLEGGFSQFTPPQPQGVYTVNTAYTGAMCLGYDPQRVEDWDTQTGTNLKGYTPNPNTFTNLVTFTPTPDAPYDVLPFADNIYKGECEANPQPNPSPQPQPQPQPAPGQCIEDILNAIEEYEANPQQAAADLVDGIECILSTLGITPASLIQLMLRSGDVAAEEVLWEAVEWDAHKVREVVKAWLHL